MDLDTVRCPDCKSKRLRLESTRDIVPPRSGPDKKPTARMKSIRCERCGHSWTVLRKLESPPAETNHDPA